jgi:hypothetical protein
MSTYLDQLPLDLKIEEAKFVHKERMTPVHEELLKHVYTYGSGDYYSDTKYTLSLHGNTYIWGNAYRPHVIKITNVKEVKKLVMERHLDDLKWMLDRTATQIIVCKKARIDYSEVLDSFYNRYKLNV